jgi:cell division septation protein DedD
MDFGGGAIAYSDDAGDSWNEVRSLATLGAEGAIVEAPGGDTVGVTWDPYTGDRLEAFKFEASTGKWFYAQNSLHQPFFDRPYISVAPGPFQIGGVTVPYITYMLGGWPQKTTYMSTDGLNYVPTSNPNAPLGSAKSEYLNLGSDAAADWFQPLTVPGIVPLPGGGAIGWKPASGGTIALSLLQPPSTTWSPFTFPNNPNLKGRLLGDSAGRLHNVNVGTRMVEYQLTPDGGRTWSSVAAALPAGYEAIAPAFDRFWDFKANAALDMAVVSMYARNTATGKDQNLLMVFSTVGGQPRLEKMLFLGLGDKAYGQGLGSADRLDFITVAILPSGQIVSTFMDSQSSKPLLAITSSPQNSPSAAPESTETPSPAPTTAPTTAPSTTPTSTPTPEPTPEPSSSPPPDDVISPAITAVSDRPDPISPDGDGHRDRVKITFTTSEAAEVSVSILSKTGRLVKTIKRAALEAGTHKAVWSGKNRAGKARAGTYYYEIIAVDAAGNIGQTTEGSITVRIPT